MISSNEILDKYIDECKILAEELEGIISDLEFVESGGVIRYAVDFSEIFAFAYPQETHKEFSLFSDDPGQLCYFYQWHALHKLFIESKERIILLEPYATELQSLLLRIGKEHALRFDQLLEKLPEFLKKAEEFQSLPEFIELSKLAQDIEKYHRHLTSTEQKRFVTFFEEKSYLMLWALLRPSISPIEQLHQLFLMERFADLDSLVPVDQEFDKPLSEKWFERLVALRGKTSRPASNLDSIAIAMILSANQTLKDRNTKLLLASRSKNMRRVVAEELTNGSWPETIGNVIRHPRIFCAFYQLSEMSPAASKKQLQTRLSTVRLFLDAADFPRRSKSRLVHNSTFLDTLLNRIKGDWRAAKGLSASLEHPAIVPNEIAHDPSNRLRWVISLFQDREQFRNLLFARLNELGKALERDHELLGLFISSSINQKLNRPDENLLAEVFRHKYVLKSNLYTMPYSLQFYSQGALRLFERLNAQSDENRWEDILNIFAEGFNSKSDYERILVMAYILGTINKWSLAETYAGRALELATREADIYPHEGLLFYAICKRKSHPSVARHFEAIDLVEQASMKKIQMKNDSSYKDPRYLREKGTHILQLHSYFKNELPPDCPSDQEGIRLLEESLALSENDMQLKIYCYNNLLFYSLSLKDIGNRAVVESYYHRLIELLHVYDPSRKKWPPLILDTIGWANWVLLGAKTSKEKETALQYLDEALGSDSLTEGERTSIESRRRSIIEARIV